MPSALTRSCSLAARLKRPPILRLAPAASRLPTLLMARSPAVLSAPRLRSSASLRLIAKGPPAVRSTCSKCVLSTSAAAGLRRLICARVAARFTARSSSARSRASITNSPGWFKPVAGSLKVPLPWVIRLRVPATAGSAVRLKSPWARNCASPWVLIGPRLRLRALLRLKAAGPLRLRPRLARSVFQLRAALLRRLITAASAPAAPSDRNRAGQRPQY